MTATETERHERYSPLLKELEALSPEAPKLVNELDEVVGERLGDVRDAAIAEATGGFVIDGSIRLPGASIDGWDVSVTVPEIHSPDDVRLIRFLRQAVADLCLVLDERYGAIDLSEPDLQDLGMPLLSSPRVGVEARIAVRMSREGSLTQ
jgi:hypothetical protein